MVHVPKVRLPKVAWLLFDVSNGDGLERNGADVDGRRYVWWFRTKRAAMQKRKMHLKEQYAALVGPVKYVRP